MLPPADIQIIGSELAIRWQNGEETYLHAETLREHSPSAENQGEVDILGQRHGGHGPRKFPGVTLNGQIPVGNYGVRLVFSDGHSTGIYSWEYLKSLE